MVDEKDGWIEEEYKHLTEEAISRAEPAELSRTLNTRNGTAEGDGALGILRQALSAGRNVAVAGGWGADSSCFGTERENQNQGKVLRSTTEIEPRGVNNMVTCAMLLLQPLPPSVCHSFKRAPQHDEPILPSTQPPDQLAQTPTSNAPNHPSYILLVNTASPQPRSPPPHQFQPTIKPNLDIHPLPLSIIHSLPPSSSHSPPHPLTHSPPHPSKR